VDCNFPNTFKLKIKKGSNILVPGNGIQIPTDVCIKAHVKIQQYHSEINYLIFKLSEDIDLILGNNWLIQLKTHLDF